MGNIEIIQHDNKANDGLSLEKFSLAGCARILTTTSCPDSKDIPKIADAGKIFLEKDERIQLMHNGIKMMEKNYLGNWMTEIISQLRGCHEPQKEWIFHNIVEKLDSSSPKMLELGGHGAYYSLWLLQRIASADSYLVESDPSNLEIGRKNLSLNKRKATLLQAGIGAHCLPYQSFKCEDGIIRQLPIENLPSLFRRFCFDKLDLLHIDISGIELGFLLSGGHLFKTGKIRFVLISTHHHTITGDPLTHQKCLDFILSMGGHIIAEYSISESYSGDGLIAASFDANDSNFTVKISYARARNGMYRELEYDLAEKLQQINNIKFNMFDYFHKMLRRLWLVLPVPIRRVINKFRSMRRKLYNRQGESHG